MRLGLRLVLERLRGSSLRPCGPSQSQVPKPLPILSCSISLPVKLAPSGSERATVSTASTRWSKGKAGGIHQGYDRNHLTERVPYSMYVPCQVHHKGHYYSAVQHSTSTLTHLTVRDGTLCAGYCTEA